MKKIKILHVLTAPRAEGTPRLVLDWLSQKKIDQTVLFLNSEPDDLKIQFEQTGLPIQFNNDRKRNKYLRYLNIIKICYNESKNVKPDIVISWNQSNSYLILTGARLSGVKKLLVHIGAGPDYQSAFQIFYNLLVFWPIYIIGGKAICASQHLLNEFQSIPLIPKKIFVQIYNCIGVNNFVNSIPSDTGSKKYQAITIGNLEPIKGQDLLIKAWKEIFSRGLEWKLIIVGGGNLFNEYKRLIRELKIEDHVVLAGYKTNIPELLYESQVFVYTSGKKEGFGTVLLEAMAAGLRIVSVDIPSSREILKNGEYGILIDKRDPEVLADAIQHAVTNPVSSKEREDQITYVSSFTIAGMINNYLRQAGFDFKV